MRPKLIAIAMGLALGAVTLLLVLRVGVLALVLPVLGIAVLRRSGLSVAGGVLAAFGLGYIGLIAAANQRCAEFDRQLNASCQTYGTVEQFVLAGSVAGLGAVIATFSLVRPSLRLGHDSDRARFR